MPQNYLKMIKVANFMLYIFNRNEKTKNKKTGEKIQITLKETIIRLNQMSKQNETVSSKG